MSLISAKARCRQKRMLCPAPASHCRAAAVSWAAASCAWKAAQVDSLRMVVARYATGCCRRSGSAGSVAFNVSTRSGKVPASSRKAASSLGGASLDRKRVTCKT